MTKKSRKNIFVCAYVHNISTYRQENTMIFRNLTKLLFFGRVKESSKCYTTISVISESIRMM